MSFEYFGTTSYPSSMNLDVPLYEDIASPSYVAEDFLPAPAEPVEEEKPKFRIVHVGPYKPSKKESSPKAAKFSVNTISKTEFYPYKNGTNMTSRQAATKEKSAFTYPNMVFLALQNAPNNQAYVSDIYEFLVYNFPFFATANKSWKNCVRNNISNSQMFEKVPTSEPTNKYRGDLWKVKAESYGKLLKGVEKTISKYSNEELKLRKDADLDDILAGRAVSKPSSMPKFPSPVPNSIPLDAVQTQVAYRPVMPQVPQVPFFPPARYQSMQFPMYFNHHQYPYYFNYNH